MSEQNDDWSRQYLVERVTKRLEDYLGISASDWSYRELAEEVIAEVEWQHVIVPEAEWRDVGELAVTLARWSDVAHGYGWWEERK